MVQNLVIVQSDLNQVTLDGTPVKTTMMHMESGTLSLNTTSARIKVDYDTTHYNNSTGQIVFTQQNDLLNNVSREMEAYGNHQTIIILLSPSRGCISPRILKLSS